MAQPRAPWSSSGCPAQLQKGDLQPQHLMVCMALLLPLLALLQLLHLVAGLVLLLPLAAQLRPPVPRRIAPTQHRQRGEAHATLTSSALPQQPHFSSSPALLLSRRLAGHNGEPSCATCVAWTLRLRVESPSPLQQISQRPHLLACLAVLQPLVPPSSPGLHLSVPRGQAGSISRLSPLCGGPLATGRAGCWCCLATRWGWGGHRHGGTTMRDALQLPTLRLAMLPWSGGGLPAPAGAPGQLPLLPGQCSPRVPAGRRQGLCERAALVDAPGQQQQQLPEQATSYLPRTTVVLRPPLVLGAALAGSAAGQLLLLPLLAVSASAGSFVLCIFLMLSMNGWPVDGG